MLSASKAGALLSLAAVALSGAACTVGQTSPALFAIGGTYTGTLTYQMKGLAADSVPVTGGISVVMQDPDGLGNIAGTFTLDSGFSGNGRIGAVYNAGVITWQQFGDPGKPLFYIATVLAATYPTCNFANATFVLGQGNGGGFDGTGHLALGGTYSGVSCASGSPGDSVATTMMATLAAFNPSPA
jgi:hypothetical protein